MKHLSLFAMLPAILFSIALSACSSGDDAGNQRTTGQENADSSSHPIDPPLAAGRAEAYFTLDTGRDQMSEGTVQSQLIVVVRYGDTEQRHIIAHCRESALGTALGGGTAELLEVAGCDGEYWLETGSGMVKVSRIAHNAQTEVFRLDLPLGIDAAVRPTATPTPGE